MGNIKIIIKCLECDNKKEIVKQLEGSESFLSTSIEELVNMKTKGHFINKHLDTDKNIKMIAKSIGEYEGEYSIILEPLEEEKIKELREEYK